MQAPLTTRQQQIMDLFLSGLTYRQVAERCGLSPETINPTLRACRAKLGADGISRQSLRDALQQAQQ